MFGLLGFNPVTKSKALEYVKEKFPTAVFKVYCESCSEVFLECFFHDFLEKTNSGKWAAINVPDRWFCNAILHYSRNPSHKIVIKQPKIQVPSMGELSLFPEFISDVWAETNRLNSISLQANIEHYEKCLTGASGKSEI